MESTTSTRVPERSNRPWGFYTETDLCYKPDLLKSRDAMLLLLLHYRGYNPVRLAGASSHGKKAARGFLKLTNSEYESAVEELTEAGFIKTLEIGITQRRTYLASLSRPFKPDEEHFDGHDRLELLKAGKSLIFLPQTLIYHESQGCPLGWLETINAIRLLLWAYDNASEKGELPSRTVWTKTGPPRVECRDNLCEELNLTHEEVGEAAKELLDCGLLGETDTDRKGRRVLSLALIVPPFGTSLADLDNYIDEGF